MALFDDVVSLTLNGDTLKITESYQIKAGIITQPAAFAIRLGHGGSVRELTKRYPPHKTQFQLAINDVRQQTGFIDGYSTGGGAGATEVTFRGRDLLGRVMNTKIPVERSFSESSYLDLVELALAAVGLDATIVASNEANRKAITGTQIVESKLAEVTLEIRGTGAITEKDVVQGTTKVVHQTIKAKAGTKWYDFLKTHLERAGLFLWVAGDGTFILSVPNANQEAAYAIRRSRRGERGEGNVVDHNHDNDTSKRYTKVSVYGRSGGRNFGRTKIQAHYRDEEMVEICDGNELAQYEIFHDNDVKDIKQAELYARRKVAEANREGWSLSYTVAGHSTKALRGGGRAIWAPDTVVEVDDQELGIQGNFWIESVEYVRNPQTTTTLRLMRPQDLVFALEAA